MKRCSQTGATSLELWEPPPSLSRARMHVGHTPVDSQAQNTADFVSCMHVKTGGFTTIAAAIFFNGIGTCPVKIELGRVFILGHYCPFDFWIVVAKPDGMGVSGDL